MNEENPLVSIIVRTKDRPKLLKNALRSIAAQTYRPIEVVLVNDGGCDLDVEEIKNILGDVSLNYIRLEKNMGRAHAGNVGIENAKGKYVGFLDDDDIYYPNAIESLKNAIAINNGKIVYGKVICRNYEDFDNPNFTSEYVIGTSFDPGRLVFENFIPINSILIPKHFFNSAGPLDSIFEIYEDWDMMLRLSGIADFFFLETIVAEYSIYGSATISGKSGADFQTHYRRKILQKHLGKVTAEDFLAYIQSVIDRIVIEKDGRIHELSKLLENKDEELKSLSQDMTNTREAMMGLTRELSSVKELLSQDLTNTREAMMGLTRELSSVKEPLSASRDKLEKLAEEEKKTKELLHEVLSSNSWKITKPLRMLGAFIRKIISKRK